jgi:hypothetical protein
MAKIPIDLSQVGECAPDDYWQAGFDEAKAGWQRRMWSTDPVEQKRYDDGYDEGLTMLTAEREAEQEER